jgi:uncharacterized protein YggE
VSARITVVGRGVVAAKPDRLELGIEVTSLEPTPDGALNVVAERSAALDQILSNAGVSEGSRTTSGVWVGEEHSWEDEHQVFRGYRARNRFLIRLSDPSPLGRILKEATQQLKVAIQGPWWKVEPENEATVEACRRAAVDARKKAEAYAESLGLRLGQIVRVKEPRVREPFGYVPLSGRLASTASLGEEELDVHSGSLDVTAAVGVTFQLEQL